VGGPRLLEEAGLAALPEAGAWRDEGAIILHVLLEKDGAGPTVAGALALADEVREESRQAVDALHKLGIQVVMITGDAQAFAESVAGQLGIDRMFAVVRPEDKAAKVAQLHAEGLKVAMVGGRRERRPRNRGGGRGGRGRHRDRRRHRRGDRLCGCDPCQLGPALGAVGDPAVEGVVSQDEAKPLMGSRIQLDLGAACGRCAGADRLCDADVGWRDLDVDLDGRGRRERSIAAAAGSASRGQRADHSLRI
jgi:haloacid dehalogenase-like hydrolase